MITEMAFPRIHEEVEEKRDFLPSFFRKIFRYDPKIRIFLEDNYGLGMGFSQKDYCSVNPNISYISYEEIFTKQMVMVVRSPRDEFLQKMRPHSVLLSMLHYDSRPGRTRLLKAKEINSFSMDSIEDDRHHRLVVNYYGTSSSAVKVGFSVLRESMSSFSLSGRQPINATIIGLGCVAQAAARALECCSDEAFLGSDLPGLVVQMLPQSITKDHNALASIFQNTDMLLDATKRNDRSRSIIHNSMLGFLPVHAVIVDITADPYDLSVSPPLVKGIEGIPTGSLSKYVFAVNDPIYDSISKIVNTTERRVVVSCNAWPAFDPVDCMSIYEEQLFPMLKVILDKGCEVDIESDDLFERALARSSLNYFLKQNYKGDSHD